MLVSIYLLEEEGCYLLVAVSVAIGLVRVVVVIVVVVVALVVALGAGARASSIYELVYRNQLIRKGKESQKERK